MEYLNNRNISYVNVFDSLPPDIEILDKKLLPIAIFRLGSWGLIKATFVLVFRKSNESTHAISDNAPGFLMQYPGAYYQEYTYKGKLIE